MANETEGAVTSCSTNGTLEYAPHCAASDSDLTTNEGFQVAMDVRNQIVKTSVIVLSVIFTACACFTNGFLILVIRRFRHYRSSKYTIILIYALLNLSLLLLSVPAQAVPRLFLTPHTQYPLALCRALSVLQVTCYFMQMPCLAYFSLTRYLQLCHPALYERYVSTRAVCETHAVILVICAGYCVITEILIGRVYRNHSYSCQLPYVAPNMLFQIVVFRVIPMVIITLVAIKIHALLRIRRRQIGAELAAAYTLPSSRKRAVRKARTLARRTQSAFRLILMLSFLFFISQVCPYVIKVSFVILAIDHDVTAFHRFSYSAAFFKVVEVTLGVLYPCFNPVAFIYCDKRLKWCLSLLHIRRTVAVTPAYPGNTNTPHGTLRRQ